MSGVLMTRFPTAQHLASWAGTTPGNNESAGKVKSRRTRPGNPYLQGALGTAAMSISHTPGTYMAAKYRRIATRRGPLKVNVAVQRALLVVFSSGITARKRLSGKTDCSAYPEEARSATARVAVASGKEMVKLDHSKPSNKKNTSDACW
jgi:hypothetical protein